MHSVLGCMCTRRGVSPATLKSVPPQLGQVYISETPFLDVARNECVNYFLEETDKEYLMWIDDDVILHPQITDLLNYSYPLMAPFCWVPKMRPTVGIYNYRHLDNDPTKRKALETWSVKEVLDRLNECLEKNQPPLLKKVDAVGGGCYLVRRDVFTKTKDNDNEWYKMCWKDDNNFPCRGEDIYFFNNCHKRNIRFVVHAGIECGHISPTDMRAVARWYYAKRTPAETEEPIYQDLYEKRVRKGEQAV